MKLENCLLIYCIIQLSFASPSQRYPLMNNLVLETFFLYSCLLSDSDIAVCGNNRRVLTLRTYGETPRASLPSFTIQCKRNDSTAREGASGEGEKVRSGGGRGGGPLETREQAGVTRDNTARTTYAPDG